MNRRAEAIPEEILQTFRQAREELASFAKNAISNAEGATRAQELLRAHGAQLRDIVTLLQDNAIDRETLIITLGEFAKTSDGIDTLIGITAKQWLVHAEKWTTTSGMWDNAIGPRT